MQKIISFIGGCIFLSVLVSCGGSGTKKQDFSGVFFTESGIRFELKTDSTTLIQFKDSTTYEGTWSISHTEDNQEYANWKSHATLTLLAKQDCPLWLQYD